MMEVGNRGLSKLETYLLIMKVLGDWDSLTQKQIMEKAGLNLVSPKGYLAFLVKLDISRGKDFWNQNRIFYSTQRTKCNCIFWTNGR